MATEVYEGAIGIDLGEICSQPTIALVFCAVLRADSRAGTTYSCVANYEGNNVEISMFQSRFLLSSRPVALSLED